MGSMSSVPARPPAGLVAPQSPQSAAAEAHALLMGSSALQPVSVTSALQAPLPRAPAPAPQAAAVVTAGSADAAAAAAEAAQQASRSSSGRRSASFSFGEPSPSDAAASAGSGPGRSSDDSARSHSFTILGGGPGLQTPRLQAPPERLSAAESAAPATSGAPAEAATAGHPAPVAGQSTIRVTLSPWEAAVAALPAAAAAAVSAAPAGSQQLAADPAAATAPPASIQNGVTPQQQPPPSVRASHTLGGPSLGLMRSSPPASPPPTPQQVLCVSCTVAGFRLCVQDECKNFSRLPCVMLECTLVSHFARSSAISHDLRTDTSRCSNSHAPQAADGAFGEASEVAAGVSRRHTVSEPGTPQQLPPPPGTDAAATARSESHGGGGGAASTAESIWPREEAEAAAAQPPLSGVFQRLDQSISAPSTPTASTSQAGRPFEGSAAATAPGTPAGAAERLLQQMQEPSRGRAERSVPAAHDGGIINAGEIPAGGGGVRIPAGASGEAQEAPPYGEALWRPEAAEASEEAAEAVEEASEAAVPLIPQPAAPVFHRSTPQRQPTAAAEPAAAAPRAAPFAGPAATEPLLAAAAQEVEKAPPPDPEAVIWAEPAHHSDSIEPPARVRFRFAVATSFLVVCCHRPAGNCYLSLPLLRRFLFSRRSWDCRAEQGRSSFMLDISSFVTFRRGVSIPIHGGHGLRLVSGDVLT